MSAWWWALIGLAVWFAPAVVAGLMLGGAILQHRGRRRKPARSQQQLPERQPPSDS
jgi:cytochrome c-type biogenesis protein CcmH/NrfF